MINIQDIQVVDSKTIIDDLNNRETKVTRLEVHGFKCLSIHEMDMYEGGWYKTVFLQEKTGKLPEYPGPDNESDLLSWENEVLNIAAEITGCSFYRRYSGPCRSFAHEPCVRPPRGGRIKITWMGGWDI